MADAPPSGASLATIEAYQATIPKADFTNPQISALLKSESEQALGGYYDNVTVITTSWDPLPAIGASAPPWNGPLPPTVVTEAVWVPNGDQLIKDSGGASPPASVGQWIGAISAGAVCTFAIGGAIAVTVGGVTDVAAPMA